MIKRADPFLTLRAVAIRHGDQVLFRGLNWEYLRNQRWAVVGQNGSGKSTFVRALLGDLPVVGGEIIYRFAQDIDGHSGWESLGELQIACVSLEQHRELVGQAIIFSPCVRALR